MKLHKFSAWLLVLALFMVPLAVHGEDLEPFTVVLLPDTQNYSEKYPETYMAQMQWIRDNAEKENIAFVIHLGDVVQNFHAEKEWQAADAAHKILDGHVPYSMLPGNHDMKYVEEQITYETPLYDKYFPPERFTGQAWYGGHMGDNNVCNYCTFKAADMDFLVVSLIFAPNQSMLDWADGVLKAHPDHRVILATHYHMRPEGRSSEEKPYGLDGYAGERLWNAFIKQHATIFMVVSGHVLGVHHQVATNDTGEPVIEILSDYQGEENGGDGWLQTMRFVPQENKIYVEAFSPTLNDTRSGLPDTYTLDYAMAETTAQAP
jgi:hypothetical protein